ncbi:TIGR02206 family membrane protein [Fictibacillus sp. 18YEL24]|uniref:YwaF family protein n=1 Tax=Fictibacillus sp. 18YEL24 TaxID=2745875 RepID=UPI0018CEFEB1|nr:TIGR02206 family membrane protein [Fictibacillus sp. 18YEL24]MBH0171558.1 TIGR02206 family membrane protein [Fictibacillus sp. 18YEL24]
MENWFSAGTSGFRMFQWEHVSLLVFIFFVSISMYGYRIRIRKMHVWKKILITGLIVSESTYHIWAIHNDLWDLHIFLPLQLCSFNILLCVLLLLTDNRRLFAFVYLFGLTGAVQGLLTPELFQEPWHFRFIQYFLAHAFIVWTALYYAIIKSYTISWQLLFQSFLWLNVYAVLVYVVDVAIDANYMFLLEKPSSASLMDFLGPYPWYILSLELVAFCLCLLVFIPVKEKRIHSKKCHPPLKA